MASARVASPNDAGAIPRWVIGSVAIGDAPANVGPFQHLPASPAGSLASASSAPSSRISTSTLPGWSGAFEYGHRPWRWSALVAAGLGGRTGRCNPPAGLECQSTGQPVFSRRQSAGDEHVQVSFTQLAALARPLDKPFPGPVESGKSMSFEDGGVSRLAPAQRLAHASVVPSVYSRSTTGQALLEAQGR